MEPTEFTETFDTRAAKVCVSGVPFESEALAGGHGLTLTVHLRGAYRCAVTDPARYAEARDVLPAAAESLFCAALLDAFAGLPGGRPEDLPSRSGEISGRIKRSPAASSFRERLGLTLEEVVVERAELSPEQETMLSRMRERASLLTPERCAERILAAQAAAVAAASFVHETKRWNCLCGAVNDGKFCPECGRPREWQCACGQRNAGNFCSACGKKRA